MIARIIINGRSNTPKNKDSTPTRTDAINASIRRAISQTLIILCIKSIFMYFQSR